VSSEAHYPRHSALDSEPPTAASLPPSDEGVLYQRSLDTWGNQLGKKLDTTLRIVFQNIGGFQKDEEMDLKLEALHRFVTEQEVDIFGFTKANTCWDLMPENRRLAHRTRGWWETGQWTCTHNRTERHDGDNSIFQPGGMGLLCVNQVAHKVLRPGDDPLGLGRWCWTRIHGPQGFFLRVVTMYRPCRMNGPLTVYQQHLRKLVAIQRFECPRDAILIDLEKEITCWQDEGDHIIILTDFNDDITAPETCRWAARLGLVEALTWLYPTSPPPTYQRGQRSIDGIFIAPQLLAMAAGGYRSFGDAVPSDHRAIWLDLHLPEICPVQQAAHIKPSTRRLKCNDPRVVERYNQELLKILHHDHIPDRVHELNEVLLRPNHLRRKHRHELNAIDHKVTKAKILAETHCRKLKCGAVQWCPRVMAAINKILFWKSVLKRESGGLVGLMILTARTKKAGIVDIPCPGELPSATIQGHISRAYKQFQFLKKEDNRRDTWIGQLIAAQAEAWNKPKKRLWNQLQSTERIRRTAYNVRRALNKVIQH